MKVQLPNLFSEDLIDRAHSLDIAAPVNQIQVQLRPLFLQATSIHGSVSRENPQRLGPTEGYPNSRARRQCNRLQPPGPALPVRCQDARSRRQYQRLQHGKSQRKAKETRNLSAKHSRRLDIHDIPKTQQKYSFYLPLYPIWCQYMRTILGIGKSSGGLCSHCKPTRTYVSPERAGPMLVTADYHGAILTVMRSRCASRVGLSGIVAKDNQYTFEIVTSKDELKFIPKEGSVFRFKLPMIDSQRDSEIFLCCLNKESKDMPCLKKSTELKKHQFVFDVYGDRFKSQASERAIKKVRHHMRCDR